MKTSRNIKKERIIVSAETIEQFQLESRRRKARNSLLHYTKEIMPYYRINWHHAVIAKYLELVEKGVLKRLLILTPPQHGKSELASIAFPSWYKGRHPERNVLATSYSASLANNFGRKTRNIVQDDLTFRVIFPELEVADDSHAVNKWVTRKRDDPRKMEGSYEAAGIGGAITGKRAHIAIVDDPLKNMEEAYSSNIREAHWDWFHSALTTRLSPNGAVIVIMTNWHDDDLGGRIQEEARNDIKRGKKPFDTWVTLKFPAIAEDDEEFRKKGEALWADEYSADILLDRKSRMPEKIWRSVYQQDARSAEGTILRRDAWGWYKELPDIEPIQIVQCWDTAQEIGKSNDWTVCTTWAEYETGYYLLDIWRKRVQYPELVKQIYILNNEYSADAILVENKSSGVALIQELKRDAKLDVIGVEPKQRSKQVRLLSVIPAIESRRVKLPDPKYIKADWLESFLDECAGFDSYPYDDQVDSMVYALEYMRRGHPMISI